MKACLQICYPGKNETKKKENQNKVALHYFIYQLTLATGICFMRGY